MLTILVSAWRLGTDLPLCLFVQTVVFVIFNKVSTAQVCFSTIDPVPSQTGKHAQYFAWYHSLLPLLLPASGLSSTRGASLFFAWLLGEVRCCSLRFLPRL
jgi:hypothetical protein